MPKLAGRIDRGGLDSGRQKQSDKCLGLIDRLRLVAAQLRGQPGTTGEAPTQQLTQNASR
jgi:hypothetical protein